MDVFSAAPLVIGVFLIAIIALASAADRIASIAGTRPSGFKSSRLSRRSKV
jgi:hypothetical protein